MRILVAGAGGKIGSQLLTSLAVNHDVTGYTSSQLDITNMAQVQTIIEATQPQLVINAAAWTDVDGCANDPERAIVVNGYGAQNLAIASYEVGSAILQISSNEVFDGTLNRPYYEYDTLRAVNPYGYSKLVGERAVVQMNPRHYITRTSWNFSHGGRNFIHAILDAAKAGKNLRVVVDEIANPTYNDDFVAAILQLIDTGRYGTYHLANSGSASRYHFARYVLDQAGFQDIEIAPISHHEWKRPSTPPIYTSLANVAARQLGIVLPHWQDAVSSFLEKEHLLQDVTS
ncbi:MAG: dTDP-4-dehydrorhamnose reductase [Phototrophicaceae bacterium]